MNDAPQPPEQTPEPKPRRSAKIRIKWNVVVPVAVLALALIGVLWMTLATSGEAEPPPLMGEVGTPVRGTFVPPTPTPVGARPTPPPRPTVGPQVPGTPAERDAQRRADQLTLTAALLQYRTDNGAFPTTNGQIQTLCAYVDLDVGCAVGEYVDPVPRDPLAAVEDAGYWYRSDGTTAFVYISFEGPVLDERCETDYVLFEDLPNLICPPIE
jgi:hypothetical protein